MALPTFNAPVEVYLDTGTTGQSTQQRGAIFYGGAYFVFLGLSGFPESPTDIRAFMSVDGGLTWTGQDTADEPANALQAGAISWDGSSSTVTVAYQDYTGFIAGRIRFQDFDLATQTWGAAYGTSGGPVLLPLGLWKRSNSTWIILARDQFDNTVLSAAQYTPGSSTWGSPFDVAANMRLLSGYDPASAKVLGPTSKLDPSDALHVIWSIQSSVTIPARWNNRFFYQRISVANALGSFTDFPGQNAVLASQDLTYTGTFPVSIGPPVSAIDIVGDTLIWGVYRNQIGGITAATFPALYLGTPLSGPVWTETGTIDATGSAQATLSKAMSDYPAVQYDAGSGTLYVMFMRPNVSDVVCQIVCATNTSGVYTSGWSTETVLDTSVTPLVPPVDPSTLLLAPLLTLGSVKGYAFSVQSNVGEPIPLPWRWEAGLPTSSLALDCNSPPAGTQGTPYTHTLVVTGGTGPYTFAITAGALPTGLTLGVSSGIISGTPTAGGTFSFTVMVTDSLLATASVTCSIVISSLFGPMAILLRGVKRRKSPGCGDCPVEPAPKLQPVKRAM